MRRLLTLVLAVMAVGLFMAPALGAGQEKVEVCHSEGNGAFHLIAVADPAVDMHMAHGDVTPGGPVPDMPGYEFDEDCQPVEALTVSASVGFSGGVGNVVADENGLTFYFGGDVHNERSLQYHQDYWGSYPLYIPGPCPDQCAIPVVDVNISGVPQETLTVGFDAYRINSDGTVGTSSTPYVGSSFQYSFVALEGTTTQVIPAGVVPDVSEPYGFQVLNSGGVPNGLHLGVAKVFLGTDTSGEPLLTVTSIVDLA